MGAKPLAHISVELYLQSIPIVISCLFRASHRCSYGKVVLAGQAKNSQRP